MKNNGWIAVDLDGTLAKYEGWVSVHHIGDPIPAMVVRVKYWLAEGMDVRIFTARVGPQKDVNDTIRARDAIEKWCLEHVGQVLPVTATKDFAMRELWDDRSVQVIPNSGVPLRELSEKAAAVVEHLSKRVGTNADWPMAITADNEDDAAKLCALLNDFENLLKLVSE